MNAGEERSESDSEKSVDPMATRDSSQPLNIESMSNLRFLPTEAAPVAGDPVGGVDADCGPQISISPGPYIASMMMKMIRS